MTTLEIGQFRLPSWKGAEWYCVGSAGTVDRSLNDKATVKASRRPSYQATQCGVPAILIPSNHERSLKDELMQN